VLVACWNAEASIEPAVRSALEPSDPGIEVIVVDDGSTDGTADVVRRLASEDDRVRLLVLAENVGASAARNRGLELVSGEWLTILDADDRFAPGGLERLISAATTSTAKAVIGQQFWTDGGVPWITSQYDIPDIREPGRKRLADHPGLLYFVSPHAKLLHRSTWEGLRFDGRMLGDQAWIIRALLAAGDGIEVIGDDVYEWHRPPRQGRASSITTRSRSAVASGVEAAAVARRSFEAVAADAADLAAPERKRLLMTYMERLLQYDLAPHVIEALDRRDPEAATLIDAVTAFVRAMPPQVLGASGTLARDALGPLLIRWHRMNRAARAAYGRLATAVLGPDARRRLRVTDARYRVVLALGAALPLRIAGPIAQLILGLTMLPGWAARRVRSRFSGVGVGRVAVGRL